MIVVEREVAPYVTTRCRVRHVFAGISEPVLVQDVAFEPSGLDDNRPPTARDSREPHVLDVTATSIRGLHRLPAQFASIEGSKTSRPTPRHRRLATFHPPRAVASPRLCSQLPMQTLRRCRFQPLRGEEVPRPRTAFGHFLDCRERTEDLAEKRQMSTHLRTSVPTQRSGGDE
jgi:hypothetical protein